MRSSTDTFSGTNSLSSVSADWLTYQATSGEKIHRIANGMPTRKALSPGMAARMMLSTAIAGACHIDR
ncbi:hypothetical protein D3C71_1073720 [compost metagenome]